MRLLVDKNATDVYGDALVRMGYLDSRVVVIDADLARATQTVRFKEHFPDRYFDVGIAEQNLLSIAAGMAVSGKIPFVATFANFITKRACDQINISIAYTKANVRIVGIEPGLSSGRNGATHQSIDDLAIMRAIPEMTVVDPADATEINQIIACTLQWLGPVYIRMQRGKIPMLFDPDLYETKIGQGTIITEGSEVCLISTGIMTPTAVLALAKLSSLGIQAGHAHFHTLKPIDKPLLISLAERYSAFVTCENHSIIGGLGGAVAEVCAAAHPMPIEFVGIADCFGETGSQSYLEEKFGLDVKAIVNAAMRAHARLLSAR